MHSLLAYATTVCLSCVLFHLLGRANILDGWVAPEKEVKPASIRDYATHAKKHLTPFEWQFLVDGAADSLTVLDNVCAYRKWSLERKLLRNVDGYKSESEIQGRKSLAPIGISPSAYQQIFHPDGELGTARAVAAANVTMVLSLYSGYSIEEVTSKVPGLNVWQMMHIHQNKSLALSFIRRFEATGCKAFVITIDKPIREIRYWRKKYSTVGNLLGRLNMSANMGSLSFEEYLVENNLPVTPTWEGLAWVVKQTHLPVVAKGILSAEDAKKAVKAGVKGVFVSNHGGRVLDGVPATISVLEEVVAAVKTSGVEVYIDGGIKNGMDVFRALALGANAVFVGRAPLYGLAHSGEAGVTDVLNILISELENTMGMVGATSVADINSDMVRKRPDGPVVSCDRDSDFL